MFKKHLLLSREEGEKCDALFFNYFKNGLPKSKSHLKEKVTPVFNTRYTLSHLPSYLAEFSNYAELCTFEYTWSTAEEGTSSPVHHLCVPPPIWVLFLFSFFS